MQKPSYVYVTYINSTPQKIWQALTSKTGMAKYFYGRTVHSTWKVGAPIETHTPEGKVDWKGKVLACKPHTRLEYSFQIMGFMKKMGRVVFELVPQGKTVLVKFAHYGVEKRCVEGIGFGWPCFFASLKSYLETGKPVVVPSSCEKK